MSRHDHLNPDMQPQTDDEVLRQLGIPASMKDTLLKHVAQTPWDNIMKGHAHRDGVGVRQDYGMAAKFYAKASQEGIPEGMYNLGQLHYHGRGVQRDYDLARHWYVKASNGKPIIMVNFSIDFVVNKSAFRKVVESQKHNTHWV